MIRVRILKQMLTIPGPGPGIEFTPGMVCDWPEHDVERSVRAGLMEVLEEQKPEPTATKAGAKK